MVPAFHVTGSTQPRPEAARVLYADGSAGEDFHPDVDLELSHWVPNRTPTRWKADTSTEICLRFLADPPAEDYDLCVNNHVDVDGLLSLFALTHPDLALAHREVLVGAAEMGDFSACAPRAAQVLFLGLTCLMETAADAGWDSQRTFQEAFAAVPGLLQGLWQDPRVDAGLAILARDIERIESGQVLVAEAGERLVLFRFPFLAGEELARALRIPEFNELPTEACWLWPQARNRFDGEAVHLVTVPAEGGCYFDLHLPGYMWAETPARWRAPGFVSSGSTNGYRYRFPELEAAVASLNQREAGPGTWTLATTLTPFASLPGRRFPVVLSCLGEGSRPCPSNLDELEVARLLEPVFEGT